MHSCMAELAGTEQRSARIIADRSVLADLDDIYRVDEYPCSHAQNVWFPSFHVIVAIQLCSCLSGPAARGVKDIPFRP